MLRFLGTLILLVSCAYAQSIVPAPSTDTGKQKTVVSDDDLFPPHRLDGKVSLTRGVLKKIDPIHDQLIIQTFGGGNIRVGFDMQTKLLPEGTQINSIRAGSVISADTVSEDGKIFARSVRVGTSGEAAELEGQVIRYDPTRSQLILHDPINPKTISLRVTPSTTVVKQGQTFSPQALSPDMLVRVWISTAQIAKTVEILAERGHSYTFEGRVIAVDLRSHVLSLSNDTDQSLRELSFGTLDSGIRSLLREGADVTIEAEFDGNRYNVRNVTAAPQNP
jgi:hypothetical protein